MLKYQWYCPKCGFMSFLFNINDNICKCCTTQMLETPREYDLTWEKAKENLNNFKEVQNQLINEVISKLPEFDKNLYNNRDLILKQKQQQQDESVARGKAILEESRRVPKCPSCGSSNISKIGLLNRAVSFNVVGFASSKIGKTHKCNHCGTTW